MPPWPAYGAAPPVGFIPRTMVFGSARCPNYDNTPEDIVR